MRRQREEEDYWDEYEDYNLDSSSDESDCDEPSPDLPSSDEEKEELTRDDRRGKGTHEGLRDDEGGVLLVIGERPFEPAWRSDAGGYLQGVRGCGSSATEKQKKRRNKELEKSASQTRPIVDMLSTQHEQNEGHHSPPPSDPLWLLVLSQSSSAKVIKKVETKFELQT